uniref:Uncharacterized protein n=1 Tax=Plectus sambesii TaxID=2011161 RepID=A0A914VFR2_9BILA
MNFCLLFLGALAFLCLSVPSSARPTAVEKDQIQTEDDDSIGGVIDPHKLLKELFADRPLKFDKNGVVWNTQRQSAQSLREMKKMRCFFNPVSC